MHKTDLVEEDLVSDAVPQVLHPVVEVRRRQVRQSRGRPLDASEVDPLQAQADQAFRVTHVPAKTYKFIETIIYILSFEIIFSALFSGKIQWTQTANVGFLCLKCVNLLVGDQLWLKNNRMELKIILEIN